MDQVDSSSAPPATPTLSHVVDQVVAPSVTLTWHSFDVQLATLEQAQAHQSRGAREGAAVAPGDLKTALSHLKAEIWTEERSEVGHRCSLNYGRQLFTVALGSPGAGRQPAESMLDGLCILCTGVMPLYTVWMCLLWGRQLQGARPLRKLPTTSEHVPCLLCTSQPVSPQHPNAGIWEFLGLPGAALSRQLPVVLLPLLDIPPPESTSRLKCGCAATGGPSPRDLPPAHA